MIRTTPSNGVSPPCSRRVALDGRFRKNTLQYRRRIGRVSARPIMTPLKLQPLDDRYEQTHGFASFSNWIVPSHLMVGRYPYVEPGELKKCRTHEEGEAQLKKILEAGVRTFVSLQVTIQFKECRSESVCSRVMSCLKMKCLWEGIKDSCRTNNRLSLLWLPWQDPHPKKPLQAFAMHSSISSCRRLPFVQRRER